MTPRVRSIGMRGRLAVAVLAFIAAVAVAVTIARAQPGSWYPSRWGAADQRGAANRITPATGREAKYVIERGVVYQLGRTSEASMPMFGTRHYSMRIPDMVRPTATNQATYHDEIISGELGQIGTQ